MKRHHVAQEFLKAQISKSNNPINSIFTYSPIVLLFSTIIYLWPWVQWDHWLTQCPYAFLRDLHTPELRYIFFVAFCLSGDTFSLVTFYAAYKSTSSLICYLGGRQKKVSKVTDCIFRKEIDASIRSLSHRFFGAMIAFCCFLLLSCRGPNPEKQESTNIFSQVSQRCFCSSCSQIAVQLWVQISTP